MRFKFTRLPPVPDDLDVLWQARATLPRTPDPESDCCGRIGRELNVDPARAREWFTLLRVLGLVEQTGRGYVEVEDRPDDDVLADRLFDRVYGAETLRSELEAAGGTAPRDEVFETVAESVTSWERLRRRRTWREEWEAGFDRLLDWLAAFDAIDRDDGDLRLVEM